MSKEDKKQLISQEDVMKLLDVCYDKCIQGIPKVSQNVEKLANDYLSRHATKEEACKAMLKNQVIKCTTSGVLSGIGGFICLPAAIPANISSVLYMQMRMIACTAHIAGYEINSDQVQTFVYACLAGVSVTELLKQAGVKIGSKVAYNMIQKIPGKVLTKINQKVGFRLLTKFGTTGVVNLGKLVPGVGAVVGGGFDLVETKIIADRAYKWFIEGDFAATNAEDEGVDDSAGVEFDEVKKSKEPLYSNEKVTFMSAGTEKTGTIEYVDLYAFGINEICYDIYVEDEQCLYKHVRESEILTETEETQYNIDNKNAKL